MIRLYIHILEYIIFIKAILCLFKNKTNILFMAVSIKFKWTALKSL